MKYEHLVAGVTGGVTSTVLLHPLDLLKIRFAGEKCLYYSLCLIVWKFVYHLRRRILLIVRECIYILKVIEYRLRF